MQRKRISPLLHERMFDVTQLFIFIFSVICAGVFASGTALAEDFSKKDHKKNNSQTSTINTDRILEQYNASDIDSEMEILHTYAEMADRLKQIAHMSKGRIKVGPLVNSEGKGLLPVDEGLMTDIINTVPSPGLRNNIENFGLSTQGRAIMAARAGNSKSGRKVLIISQQHGNEVTSTEAALNFLEQLAAAKDTTLKKMLDRLDILFIIRANPDGGEPDPQNCLMSDEIPFWGMPFADGSMDCALHRFTVDPRAGFAGLIPLADPPVGNLFGVPFSGYDMNRYHYVSLDGPIYPAETQAVVYAMKVFAPEFMLDLHNQNIKSRCSHETEEDYAKCMDGSAGEQVDGTIQAGSIIMPPRDPKIQARAERLGAHLLARLNKNKALFTRFAQASSSLHPDSRTSVDAAMELGIVAHWLEVRCNSEIIGHAAIRDGAKSLGVMLGMPTIGKDFRDTVRFHETGIREYLLGIAGGIGDIDTENGGFDTNPAWNPPNFDLFVYSDQLSAILLQTGNLEVPITDETRIVINAIE